MNPGGSLTRKVPEVLEVDLDLGQAMALMNGVSTACEREVRYGHPIEGPNESEQPAQLSLETLLSAWGPYGQSYSASCRCGPRDPRLDLSLLAGSRRFPSLALTVDSD